MLQPIKFITHRAALLGQAYLMSIFDDNNYRMEVDGVFFGRYRGFDPHSEAMV